MRKFRARWWLDIIIPEPDWDYPEPGPYDPGLEGETTDEFWDRMAGRIVDGMSDGLTIEVFGERKLREWAMSGKSPLDDARAGLIECVNAYQKR